MNQNTLEQARLQNESLIKIYSEGLEQEIESLIKTLSNELKMMKKHKEIGKIYKPNELGIIQSAGYSIDNLCGRLGSLLNIKEHLK